MSRDLEGVFQRDIAGGPGAFMVTADSPDSFADAVRRKLILRIASEAPAMHLTLRRAPPDGG